MAPATLRLLLIEGENADGATVEQDHIEVAAADQVAAQVVAAIVGTREGAVAAGHRLTSIGVTWADPADPAAVGVLRDELAARDLGGVMLVSPLLAAAALAQTVGSSIAYERIAMLFVEPKNATLAVVEVADGSIAELHRQPLPAGQSASRRAAHLATMVAGLDARGSRADGVFLIGCGADIVSIKPALEAVTSLQVSAPEEPDMALARGAALASANAPLFSSSTAALAYALDPATGEMSPGAFGPTNLAYSALEEALEEEADEDEGSPRRTSFLVAGSALAAIFAVVAGVLLVSLTADRPSAARQHPRASVANPAQVPSQLPQAQLPAPTSPPPPPSPPPAPTAVAAPPPPPAYTAPAAPPAPQVRRAPTPRAPASVPSPVPQAAPTPAAPPPAAPPPQPAPAAVPTRPPMTMYLHFPFVTVPIPITPPPPPPPPPPAP